MQWFILQNVTRENLASRSLENLCFREGGTQLYIIWTEKEDPEMLESILWSYEYCRSFLAQHFEFRYDIAVSGGHTGIDGVYKAYREVCRVYQYQQRTQDTGTIFYSDLKVQPGDTTVRYPVETENKLHLAVRSGDEGEACTQIQVLMRQNQENYLSPAGMQFLVGKIMSTIVRAGEQRSMIQSWPKIKIASWRPPAVAAPRRWSRRFAGWQAQSAKQYVPPNRRRQRMKKAACIWRCGTTLRLTIRMLR